MRIRIENDMMSYQNDFISSDGNIFDFVIDEDNKRVFVNDFDVSSDSSKIKILNMDNLQI